LARSDEQDEDASFDFGENEQSSLFGDAVELAEEQFVASANAEEDDTSFNFGDLESPDMGAMFGAVKTAAKTNHQAGPLAPEPPSGEAVEGFRAPGDAASLPEVLKFLMDRSGYVRMLEEENNPEAQSRIENLQELVNAARDAHERGEGITEFLDHAALVSDTDDIDPNASVTLMTLHAAKGLEFPFVVLAGLEEGLFPHSRTLLNPEEIEEERRLCYVGITRAMDQLIMTRARYRRRFGNDMPEASVASRFLEEIPPSLIEYTHPVGSSRGQVNHDYSDRHYSYEDEDQSATSNYYGRERSYSTQQQRRSSYSGAQNSIDNIADFFVSKGKKFTRPKLEVEVPKGDAGLKPGTRVRHPKYGEGTVYQREGEGDAAKITVAFRTAGVKKLVEKFAQLERV
jgi:DNA helicase-2/ATP-dependent DNA helicase PcrA